MLRENASSFAGRVTNEAGEPVTRFRVTLEGPRFLHQRDFASADGTFVYDGLPKLGTTMIDVIALGYLDAGRQFRRLGRREHIDDLDIVLKRGRRVSGVVFDLQTRAPLAFANVKRTGTFGLKDVGNGRARTDALGRFALVGLEPGRAELEVSRSGYRSHAEVIDTTNEAELRIGLRSGSGSESEYSGVGMRFRDVELPDAGSGSIVAAVNEQGGARVAGIQVGDEILEAAGVPAGSVSTEEFLRQIKGTEGTLVRLKVRRASNTFEVTAVRRRIASW